MPDTYRRSRACPAVREPGGISKVERLDTLYCWGQALASIGDYSQAAERLRQALAIRPDSIAARLKLGDVLRESGDTTQSAELFRRVLIEKPDNASVHYGLGRVLEG